MKTLSDCFGISGPEELAEPIGSVLAEVRRVGKSPANFAAAAAAGLLSFSRQSSATASFAR